MYNAIISGTISWGFSALQCLQATSGIYDIAFLRRPEYTCPVWMLKIKCMPHNCTRAQAQGHDTRQACYQGMPFSHGITASADYCWQKVQWLLSLAAAAWHQLQISPKKSLQGDVASVILIVDILADNATLPSSMHTCLCNFQI